MKWVVCGFLLVATLLFSLCAGHEWSGPEMIWRALGGDGGLAARLLTEWRLPRVLAAGLVGMLLGLSGGLFQGIFRNPLAEPWLLGSAGGAAVGATIALLVPLGMPMELSLPLLTFTGTLGAALLVLGIARVAGTLDTATLLLAGVATSAVLGAIRSFLMLALSNESISLQVVMSWLMGGVQTPTWSGLGLAALTASACLILSLGLARKLDLLGLGENLAAAYGLNVGRFSALALILASATVAAAVALGGVVAFVGLAAPHIARWLGGTRHCRLLPLAGLLGAILVMLADGLARSLLPPGEIPIGLITAVAGGPFFIFLLYRRARS
jgi:iron complex transport system permease protein